jgi:metal transporter CNNM
MNLKFLVLMFCFINLIFLTKQGDIEVKAIYNEERGVLIYEGREYSIKLQNLAELAELTTNAESTAEITQFWVNISLITFFTLFAGAMSGLTVGYLSIDDLVLELKSKTGTDIEQKYANRILPIISKRHWLLVTLLLMNATAMEALPIFLNKLVDEYMAIMISVTLVLFFGEIIPQALCTGPSQLKIASFLSPMVKLLMWASWPISYPIALILDWLVGKHSKSRFVNTDLKGLIELHTLEALEKLSKEQGHDMERGPVEIGLHNEQADLMISALEIKQRKALEMMIPLEKVFMIDCDQPLDQQTINLILDKGFSRIPIYKNDRNFIIGILRIKQLIGIDTCHGKSISQLGIQLSMPIIVDPNTPALELLSEFRKGKSHMSFLTPDAQRLIEIMAINNSGHRLSTKNLILQNKKQQPIKVLGLVTLEDVLEKMINIEILDEDDYARNKILHEKKGVSQKSRFYKNAITRELALSLVEENKEKLSMLVSNSLRNGTMLLDNLEKGNTSIYEDPSIKLREPLL